MTAYAWLVENRSKYANRTELMKVCREITGKCQSTVSEALSKLEKTDTVRCDSPAEWITSTDSLPLYSTPTPISSKVKSLNDFRSQFDNIYKIKVAIAKLPADGYLTEMEFREFAGVSAVNLSRFKEKFEENQLKTKDKTYWAKAPFIKKMKQVIEQ